MILSSSWIILILFHLNFKPTNSLELDLSTPPLLNVDRFVYPAPIKKSILSQDVQDRVKRDKKRRIAARLESEMSRKSSISDPKKKRRSRISLRSNLPNSSTLPLPKPHRLEVGEDDSGSGSGLEYSDGSSGDGEEEEEEEEPNEEDGEEEDGTDEGSGSEEEKDEILDQTTNSIALTWPKGSPDAGKTWSMPAHSQTFKSFNITSGVSAGKDNCKVLTQGIPAIDTGAKPKTVSSSIGSSSTTSNQQSHSGLTINLGGIEVNLLKRDEEATKEMESRQLPLSQILTHPITSLASTAPESVIQVFYPKGSSNPGSEPVGGCQFYAATPLNLAQATSVTLRYSVYFTPSFNFVKGGKLPGLYGGHEGCSGGSPAEDCWSSRMMWRTNGMGELYLYVPQDKQDPALCSIPPYSECNPDYGDSIGRGAFNYTRGAWTQISQTIRLSSSPTAQDGSFNVQVNGGKPTTIKFNKVVYPTGFKGIFFSTFFGGHGSDWAATKDEHTYFKDFSVTVNH